ncbi:MAG: S-layer homology domain-containing protein, partial [Syntrophomonadaceae bacterium]|nr:S-layer homology domain-containing protein [Syntrophomonadaceae bacterium]
TATINTRTNGSAADVTGSIELKQDGSTIATASKTDTGIYTASTGNGTYDLYINNADTETDLTINNGANSATINYYTVTYSASIAGTAAGSSISATAGGTAINSGDKVLAGKQIIITAVGTGATSYTYAWSGAGTSGETTAALTIASLSSAVNAACTVTGTTTSATQLSTPANLAWDSQTPGKATWSLVDHAESYDVQLKKDGIGIGNAQSVIEAVYEFAPAITANGYGSYTFAVTAIGDGITYNNSPTVVSSVYEYAAFSSPLCSVLGVVLPANAVLNGLNINAAVSNGTTTQQIDVTVSDNAAWKLYNDSPCTNEITDKTMNLAVGGNTAYLKVTAQDGATYKIYTVTITRGGSSGDDDGSPGSSGSPPSSSPPGATSYSGANVLVNGESQSAGTLESTTNPEGQTVTTVTVDTDKLNQILEAEDDNATVTISAATGSNMVTGLLTGQMVKSMEEKEATLVVQSGSAVYTVPAAEINIDAVSEQLGQNVTLENITVEVAIATPSAQAIAAAEQAAADSGFSIVVPALEFTINCTTYNGTTVEVSKFNTYIERTIALPEGADPNKITTGIVVKPDGSTYHVPTRITIIDGKYYAVINSLTNSTYTVVWHPIEFSDVENHWAKEAINDMGSRMIVSGVNQENYAPDQDITRAEFAAIMVKSLGLAPGTGENRFSDVEDSKWYCEYIKTASSYDIIYGYGNKTFGPNDTITREQVMAMITRVMEITGLVCTLADGESEKLLQTYSDSADASGYARESIATCLKTGLVSGKSIDTMAPKDNITRAETAVMVQRLLQKSDLI